MILRNTVWPYPFFPRTGCEVQVSSRCWSALYESFLASTQPHQRHPFLATEVLPEAWPPRTIPRDDQQAHFHMFSVKLNNWLKLGCTSWSKWSVCGSSWWSICYSAFLCLSIDDIPPIEKHQPFRRQLGRPFRRPGMLCTVCSQRYKESTHYLQLTRGCCRGIWMP